MHVAAALKERDAAVAAAERRAGKALRTMTEDEGLSVREALIWSGQPVNVREATRLMRVAGVPEAVPRGEQDEPSEGASGEVTGEAGDAAGRVREGGWGVGPSD